MSQSTSTVFMLVIPTRKSDFQVAFIHFFNSQKLEIPIPYLSLNAH